MLSAIERQQRWAAEMDALAEKYGVSIQLDIEMKRLVGPDGVVWQAVPVMRVVVAEAPVSKAE